MLKRIDRFLRLLVLMSSATFLLAGAASAYYVIGASATSSGGGYSMPNCYFGVAPITSTAPAPSTLGVFCQVSIVDPYTAPGLLSRDLTPMHPQLLWNLMLHAGPDYPEDTVILKMWTFSGSDLGYTWESYTRTCALFVVSDGSGYYSPETWLWTGRFYGETSEDDPVMEIELHVNKTDNPWHDGLYLGLWELPEPSVLIATVFGLSGIVLFRRRV